MAANIKLPKPSFNPLPDEYSTLLCGAASAGAPVSTCQDLDTGGCQVFQKANPDLCNNPVFSQSTCKRFCGNCPTECYSCPSPLGDPMDCNNTVTCGSNSTCMIKHLHAVDGHHEYIMTCEAKQMCSGLSFGFGKRHINDVEEVVAEERVRYEREVILDCCDTDYCNMPVQKTTTTTAAPTTRPTTAKPHVITTHAVPGGHTGGTSCNRDIVFVVDDSGSVGSSNFQHTLDFVRQIVSNITVGQNNAHIAMMAYSTTPQINWYLNKYSTRHQVLNAVQHVPYRSGGTRTDLALDAVMNNILTPAHGDRAHAANAVVLITDGRSNQPVLTVHEADKLRKYSHDVVTIGVGAGFDLKELSAIATDRHHVFSSHSYQNLRSIVSNIVHIICS